MIINIQFIVRILLGILFVGAGCSHFSELKHDYLAMLPSMIPGGIYMIYFTGILEVVGGIGIQFKKSRKLISTALILFLLCVLPANINAALNSIPFAGQPAIPMIPRIVAQTVLVLLIFFSCIQRYDTKK